MNYIGIDIGGTTVKIGLIDENGILKKKSVYQVAFDGYETPIIETVIHRVSEFIEDTHLPISEIHGIGVSATGQIDVTSGTVIGTAGHIKNWEGYNIKENLRKIYNGPIAVMNDANCAALAEKWIGGAKNVSNAIIMTIGTGVGGGIIVNSQILCGEKGGAGEIGHMIIHKDGKKCSCGNCGCYEQYASTTALVNNVRQAVSEGKIKADLLNDQVITGKIIFEFIAKDEYLRNIVEKWIESISDGIVSLIHIFNPEVILVGGGVSMQKNFFIEPLRRKVLKKVMPAYRRDLKIDRASLGNDAGMIGAVYSCIKNIK